MLEVTMSIKPFLNFEPTEFDLNQIDNWLLEEWKTIGSGFYFNRETIRKSLENKRLILLKIEEITVGFCVWSKGKLHIDVDIFSISPNFRKKGLGKLFIDLLSRYFYSVGKIAIKLVSISDQSHNFWTSSNFSKFPDLGGSDPESTYFKPLIKIKKPDSQSYSENRIELWNVEPSYARDKNPEWVWNFEDDSFDLSIPILQPSHYEWKISWIKNGIMVEEDKVKYFLKELGIEFSPFIYIKTLVE